VRLPERGSAWRSFAALSVVLFSLARSLIDRVIAAGRPGHSPAHRTEGDGVRVHLHWITLIALGDVRSLLHGSGPASADWMSDVLK
jgi:hypothetical protein